MVGNLAERAAEAIGADPLLTRVAAYYHDIGKLANPLAFIENQAGGDDIHDQLETDVSAQVVKQHVVDGIDLAYRAKLPDADRVHSAAPRDGDHELLPCSGPSGRRRALRGLGTAEDERLRTRSTSAGSGTPGQSRSRARRR